MYKTIKYFQKKTFVNLFINTLVSLILYILFVQYSTSGAFGDSHYSPFVIQQVNLNVNNISSWIVNNGTFDRDLRTPNTPGLEWPKGTGKFAVYASGFNIAAYVNGHLRMASALYGGEYAPGYVTVINGVPVAQTNDAFKIYSVKHGDNSFNNPDWLNWGLMVPFGAPFIDVNHNNIYEPFVDTPGVKGAAQTIFVCLTDGFSQYHDTSTGFGGGTPPLFAEVHLTAWADTVLGASDMQFLRWDVVNKNTVKWDSTYFSVVCDADLGYPGDDYIGCDTNRLMAYCYNGEDMDGTGQGRSYGLHPPAVGLRLLNCSQPSNLGMTSFVFFSEHTNVPYCQRAPSIASEAYNYMKGLKSDGTPWVYPPGGGPQFIIKYCYSGDPELGQGWEESNGTIGNCGGSLSGQLDMNSSYKVMVISSGSKNLTIQSGGSYDLTIAQLVRRGTNNLNSVTLLKLLSDYADSLCRLGFIGIKGISSNVPTQFALYQNYPNPFNSSTKIKFDIPMSPLSERGEGGFITLKIYDLLGRGVTTLVNEKLKPGTYEIDFDGTNFTSGVYFYVLSAESGMGGQTETKKMVLLK
jgi:hypothetical protein